MYLLLINFATIITPYDKTSMFLKVNIKCFRWREKKNQYSSGQFIFLVGS